MLLSIWSILFKTISTNRDAEYTKHRPDKQFGAAIWPIALYYIIFSTNPYKLGGSAVRVGDWHSHVHRFESRWGRLEPFFNFLHPT